MVGNFAYVGEGDMIEATGRLTEHPIYGEQLAGGELRDQDSRGHAVHGTISRLRCHQRHRGRFGCPDCPPIQGRTPSGSWRRSRSGLSEVKGISEKMAMAIAEQVGGEEGHAPGHDVPPELRHFHQSGRENLPGIRTEAMYSVIKDESLPAGGRHPGSRDLRWRTRLRQKVGIFTDSDYRIKSGHFVHTPPGGRQTAIHTCRRRSWCQNASELLKVRA